MLLPQRTKGMDTGQQNSAEHGGRWAEGGAGCALHCKRSCSRNHFPSQALTRRHQAPSLPMGDSPNESGAPSVLPPPALAQTPGGDTPSPARGLAVQP